MAGVAQGSIFGALLRTGLLLSLVSGAFACGSNSNGGGPYAAAGYGNGGGQTSTNVPRAIAFSPSTTVLLKPGETGVRSVLVDPPQTYNVVLSLLGASNDASLSQTMIQTGADGAGQFSITASSIATSFRVRASIGQLSQLLDVSVSPDGYATLNATGNYTGVRSVNQWAATLWSGFSCVDFGSGLPVDGTLTMHTATKPGLTLENVPVGATQAIVMQGDSSVWGCKDVRSLVAGEVLDVPIQVYDIPAIFSSGPISAEFSLTTNAATWSSNTASLNSNLLDAVKQGTNDDIDLLLDAMRAAATNASAQADFDQRRTSGNWHSILETRWSGYAADSLNTISNAVTNWLSRAETGLGKGVAIDADITLTATASSSMKLKSVAGVLAINLGAVITVPLTISTGANDGLTASTSVSFNEAYLVRTLAIGAAQVQYPDAKNVPEALGMLLDCDGLARDFDASTTSTTGCDASCLSQLCAAGLSQLWQRTDTAASQWGTSKLTLSCSGTLRTNENAIVTGYTGTWVGLLSSPTGNVTTGGSIN